MDNYLWNLGIFTFPYRLAPSWQHAGYRLLYFLSLAELYYGLTDLDRDFKFVQGVERKKTYKSNVNFGFFCKFPDKSDSTFLRPGPESERLDI